MGLYHVDTDISVHLSLTKDEGGVDSYTIRYGDMITNMTVMGEKDSISGQVVKIGVMPRLKMRNSYTMYDNIPIMSKEVNLCRAVRAFDEAMEVQEIVIHDPETCAHHHVKLSDIESIEAVSPACVIVTPDQKISTIVDSLNDGQILYLSAGEYEEDLTLTKGIVIVGAGNGVVTIKGNITVNMTDSTDFAIIGDVKITNAAAANIGMVTVSSGNLQLINDVLIVTDAKGIAECSAVNRAVTTTDDYTKILIDQCTIQVEGGETGDFNYGVEVGTATGKDMGGLMLAIKDSYISAAYVGVYCTTRGKADISVVRSRFKGFGAFYMNHNGETEVAGTYDASFDGSEVKFIESMMEGVQGNVASIGEDGCDCNTFSVIAISNTKNLKASTLNCIVSAENDPIVATGGNAKFAPMYALMIDDKSEGCLIELSNSTLKLIDPVVETATINGNPKLCGIKTENVKVVGLGSGGGIYPYHAK